MKPKHERYIPKGSTFESFVDSKLYYQNCQMYVNKRNQRFNHMHEYEGHSPQ